MAVETPLFNFIFSVELSLNKSSYLTMLLILRYKIDYPCLIGMFKFQILIALLI